MVVAGRIPVVQQHRLHWHRSAGPAGTALTEQPQAVAYNHRPGHSADTDLRIVLAGQLLHVGRVLALPLGSAVLEPDLDLRFGEIQLLGEGSALCHGQILAAFKFSFERLDLGGRKCSAWPLLAIVGAVT